MRFVLLTALLATAAAAAQPEFALILDFQGPHSETTVAEMEREFTGIMKDSGLKFEFRMRGEAEGATYHDLVLLRFKGKCLFEPAGYLYDERGPFAFTYSTGGVVQPFSEVSCDRVTASIRGAMSGGDYAKANQLLGRALGRVVAHEVVHMLAQSPDHARQGVTRPALTARQLIGASLELDPDEFPRLHTNPAHK